MQHRFIRSRDTSAIVEKPERLRAVNVGLAAAMARLESTVTKAEPDDNAGGLVAALNKLNLASSDVDPLSSPNLAVSVVKSSASVDILRHPAVKFVHGDVDEDVYLENIKAWARDSHDKIAKSESEIPEGLSQGDLYLCPTSINAIQGAIGTVCEAVDDVVGSTSCKRAFVSIRPPGHHCGEDTPAGFCFVNNVAIGAAHAHLQHGINRVVILDIDLHHGNGTQSIAWQINEETYRKTLESEALQEGGATPHKPGLQVFYGSIHDVLSYPCEDGKADLVQAASVSLHGPHGQHIENIHLQPYTSDEHFFDVLYKERYIQLLKKAEDFLANTKGNNDDVMVFISCGFDACEHEYPSMSRHGRKVPTSFYHRFTQDACAFAERHAHGRLVSVLEGGYSDRALTSGAMAHLCGLAQQGNSNVDKEWWSLENLEKLEKATKKRRGGRPSIPAAGSVEPWLERAVAIFAALDPGAGQKPPAFVAPTSMTLRGRKKADAGGGSPALSARPLDAGATEQAPQAEIPADAPPAPKKLPRVILHVRPPQDDR
ncbi:Arginase/deacetylase [Athelia psychrophila]|uniref:Arginase/deacetylase n=1 Tax=Athelia psychrophila TaxID=1759441 RepID=A0A166K4L1_9AGAM|nr:Arginase/deacetylase [Fibularhizoctonia sp. CBS 109695]